MKIKENVEVLEKQEDVKCHFCTRKISAGSDIRRAEEYDFVFHKGCAQKFHDVDPYYPKYGVCDECFMTLSPSGVCCD